MKTITFLLAVCSALLLSIGTCAAEVHFEGNGWVVTRDHTSSTCVAEQTGSDTAGLVLERTASTFTLKVTDRKLVWLEAGEAYEVTAIIDRSNWTGTMAAARIEDRGTLEIADAIEAFVQAIQAGSRLFLSLDGVRYGPYSLSGTRLVVDTLASCVASASAAATPAETDTYLPSGYMAEWTPADIGRTFRSDDIAVRMQMRDRLDETKSVTVDVSNGSSRVVSFEIEGTYGPHGTIGLIKLDRWQDAGQLLFTNFTGGAHCCTEVRIVDFSGDPPVVIDLGAFDTGTVEPEDIDGDGYLELAVPDERFRGFDSYAGSFPPHLIYTAADGKLADLTFDARFALHHRWMFDRQAAACGIEARRAPGACAGLLGTAAILGLLGPTADNLDFETMPEETAFPWTYFRCEDADCSETTKITDFVEAVRGELQRWGYIAGTPSTQFDDFMAELVGKSFGGREGSELACDLGPATIGKAVEPLGSTIYRISSYESGCSVSTGQVIGQTALVRAVCQGEGMPPWIEEQAISLQGDRLQRAIIDYREDAGDPLELCD